MKSNLCNPGTWAGMQRIAIIGGSSGIGAAAARLLLHLGSEVIVGSRTAAAGQVEGEPGYQAIQMDISKEEDVAEFFSRCGELTQVFVTAGSVVYDRLSEGAMDRFQQVIDSRIWGALAVGKHAPRVLHDKGSITFTSGGFARRPRADTTAVAAAVGGVEALARGLALELAPIRVNTVRYGIVDTEATERRFGAWKSQYLERMGASNPLGRVGMATEAAEAAISLMMNDYINGAVLTVDGGWTAGQWPSTIAG